ncbi:MAG: hypothetical protein JWQ81_1620 [Amycolatopsis sp.]|uniref:hypothetical protein n=1 Tax=Amycolatopsis sp. TaxID=37632 RepID=UPI0026335CE6|nr:hypothetical protein [Amycolatopsis sp.]MCU1680881.1 hypothetical protein [Amycolatopsis sp.]
MNRSQSNDQLAGLARELTHVNRANPLLALYQWRYELAALAVTSLALVDLIGAVGPIWALTMVACVVYEALYWPVTRRFVRARLRVVIVQHRLRTAFAHARVCTLNGRRPAILWTSSRGDEVKVLLSCPAGLGVDRIREQSRLLASACFATDVVVNRNPRFANLVVLHVRTARPTVEKAVLPRA